MPSFFGSTPKEAFFERLVDLDRLNPPACDDLVIKFLPSQVQAKGKQTRQLLGGYQEDRKDFSYTFNFWQYCDVFIYFSHHRVTIPPSSWINAAHRQGCKMLGTLIFEHVEGEEDCLRLLLGPLPSSGIRQRPPNTKSMPISPFYAKALASLARRRGFDGYLLNFECPLRGGPDQARSLCVWIELFRKELKSVIGDHAMLHWYDSVVINGQVRWQDRLNHYNLPFLTPSTGFFTNYTWPPTYPAAMSRFFSYLPESVKVSKSLADIFVGVDVWGRNQHAGGMMNCHKAISHIYASSGAADQTVENKEYSVALFGPAWTWESVREAEHMDWDTWFRFERKFWIGESNASSYPKLPENVGLPPVDPEKPRPPCLCDALPYRPITTYFSRIPRPPPDPVDLPFYTSFCPGVGRGWFVAGVNQNIMGSANAWTDVDKQTGLGDLLWPDPTVMCEDVDLSSILKCESKICMEDAWNGGSSLKLVFNLPQDGDQDGEVFWSLTVPVQSLSLTPDTAYEACLVYKVEGTEAAAIDLDLSLSVRSYVGEDADVGAAAEDHDVALTSTDTYIEGWSKLRVTFRPPAASTSSYQSRISYIGILLSVVAPPSSLSASFSILLGQLTVYPTLNPAAPLPAILWSELISPQGSGRPARIRWSTAHAHASALTYINLSLPAEDPSLAWPTPEVRPGALENFMYFNVYVEIGDIISMQGKTRQWLGTSGLDGDFSEFEIGSLERWKGKGRVRFYVQGVTDRGEAMELDTPGSSYIDVDL